ncbi:hypothetical protein COCNU_16G004270 [Cocos nucifera]|uniref:cAMP-regulated phosphoprotein 19-related protein n=1 Tax=Cocos nucifera TaxID=13894 RepID=A0A8K0IY90_COCNU|nr:hypothetical protein COCNU_16G004270 [Cocos nucifera]
MSRPIYFLFLLTTLKSYSHYFKTTLNPPSLPCFNSSPSSPYYVLSTPFSLPISFLLAHVPTCPKSQERGGLEMAGCNGERVASQEEKVSLETTYGGIVPKKKPLISKDHERAYFDSADWALGKQGVNRKTGTAIESLKPKLKRTPHHRLPPRNPKCTSSEENTA